MTGYTPPLLVSNISVSASASASSSISGGGGNGGRQKGGKVEDTMIEGTGAVSRCFLVIWRNTFF